MRVKLDPLLDKSYYKVLATLQENKKQDNYVSKIAININLTREATTRLLKRIENDKLIPKPLKEKKLNKTIYTFDEKYIVNYLVERLECPKQSEFFNFLKESISFYLTLDEESTLSNDLLSVIKHILFIYAIEQIKQKSNLDKDKVLKNFIEMLQKDFNDKDFYIYLLLVERGFSNI